MGAPQELSKTRLEALSDGVIAIIITLMVLEIKRPAFSEILGGNWHLIGHLLLHLIPYVMSFVVVAILWVNHHHMFHQMKDISSKTIWLNLHLLFWMSLIPIPTGLMGEHPHYPESNVIYGAILFACSFSYYLLRREAQFHMHHSVSQFRKRQSNRKNLISAGLYLLAIPLCFVSEYLAWAVFVAIPALYFMPEPIEPCLPGTVG